MIKFCSGCGYSFETIRSNRKYCSISCRNRVNKRAAKARPGGVDRYRTYQRQADAKLRREIIEGYGDKCQCCGEREEMFLTIDHINGRGAEHRRSLYKTNTRAFYGWLKRNNFPTENFRLLCYNCNCGRSRNGGSCPHDS